MKNRLLSWIFIFASFFLLATQAVAAPPQSVPADLVYQGSIFVDDLPFDGTGHFKLALVDETGASLWSNDGTSADGSEPAAAFPVTVNEGVFQITIGSAAMDPIDPAIFSTEDTIYLHAWFDDGTNGFSALDPPIQISSSVYSFNSQFLRGYAPDDFLKSTDQITAGQISAGAVGTAQIAAGSVTSDKITAFSGNGDTFTIGSGAAANNVILASQPGNDPGLRYNTGTSTWQASNDGAAWSDILSVPPGPAGDLLTSDGATWGSAPPPKDLYYYRVSGAASNRFYTSPNTGAAVGQATLAANTLYAMPFIVSRAVTLDAMAVRVTTAAGTLARLGIYDDDGNDYPGGLVLDAGTVATNANGVKTIAINQDLDPGLYWLTIVADGAVRIRGFNVGGMIPILGMDSGLGTAWGFGYSIAFPFGVLPANYPAAAAIRTAAPLPAIFVRF
ncbi:MAG: hypothetical protein JXA24_06460 [Proteobacteria bacterium]|nr:hypothetical protein [Pseudomonadota bacterium]